MTPEPAPRFQAFMPHQRRDLWPLRTSLVHGSLKLRSNGVSFHEFRQRFALFTVVETGRIDVVRALVSASVVSRVVVVNSSRIKEPDGPIASVHSNFAKPSAIGTALLFEFHRSQSTSRSLYKPHTVG
ncbi:hypothetical protein AVEN_270537-1 [Araneus ventricosus]|uniref:Uncharacterized protein n=1 Tax=Araneus ventricosus TaxID=182803 RepID=A0A4Y2B4L4_ARAVE|nr:hypothetical protein AVEN_270537-1 [Araneus ventricosus]